MYLKCFCIVPAWLMTEEWILKVNKCNPNSFGYVICCMHVVFMYLYVPAREGDVCLRVVAIVVLTSQAMLRKARFLFRSVPSATLWKEKQARDWAKSPGLSGERQVRLLDSLIQTPTRAVVSPGRGYFGEEHPWNRNDLRWNSEGRKGGPGSLSTNEYFRCLTHCKTNVSWLLMWTVL